ncbi:MULTISPECIES: hypothetical protein [Kitasatospora]|uniref:Uncharacterized protein n=2 Tax=Kitasatospora TaxID=2063 RepID=A0ABT1J1J6_9ACTN|nr:hypothetical protein [Kitasatospora paracochleata]MCP2311119.1 hypothetical protein [Kitasatospora paracochleata]
MSTTSPSRQYYGRPARPGRQPGDAEPAPPALLEASGPCQEDRTWRAVHIRVGGEWRTGILTVWRRPARSRVWVAHVRWGEDLAWGWFIYDRATIRQVPVPPDAQAAGRPQRRGE